MAQKESIEGTRKRFQNKDGGSRLNRQVCGVSKFAGLPLPARVDDGGSRCEKPDAAESVGKFREAKKVSIEKVLTFLTEVKALAELEKKMKKEIVKA